MKDILRQENYGIPIGEKILKVGHSRYRYGTKSYEYSCVYQMVNTNPRLELQRGDIVRFLNHPDLSEWKKNQFAVVIDRYRIVKDKGVIYRDYGMVLMMITGAKKGRAFKMSSMNCGKLTKTMM